MFAFAHGMFELLMIVVACVICSVSIKQWKPVTFFLLFLYISTLRLLHVFSIWQLNNFVNGVLMILVLKMISAVFDHRDAVYNKRLISQVSHIAGSPTAVCFTLLSPSILSYFHISQVYILITTFPRYAS